MKEIEKDFIGEIVKHEKYGYGMIKNFNIDTEIVVKGSCGAVKMTIEFNNKERDFIININNYSTIKLINKVKQEGLLQIMELISSFELPPVPPVEPPKTNPEIIDVETIYVYESNADFLNKNFGTNYKVWMKAGWKYDYDTIVWMVNIDGSVSRGWRNTISKDGQTITEKYVGDPIEQLETHKTVPDNYRIAVDKSKNYKIYGLYKIDRAVSIEKTYRIWRKVRDFYIGKNR